MAKPVTIYGIKNCDTMKKARAWLDEHGVAYAFHDYRSAGIDRGVLEGWVRAVGWETLLNRAGTTFRKLPGRDREGRIEKRTIALTLEQRWMLRGPVVETKGGMLVGFRPEESAKGFGALARRRGPELALAPAPIHLPHRLAHAVVLQALCCSRGQSFATRSAS